MEIQIYIVVMEILQKLVNKDYN